MYSDDVSGLTIGERLRRLEVGCATQAWLWVDKYDVPNSSVELRHLRLACELREWCEYSRGEVSDE